MYAAGLTALLILGIGYFLVRGQVRVASNKETPKADKGAGGSKELSRELGALLGCPSLRDPMLKEVSVVKVSIVGYEALVSTLGLFELFDFENNFYALITRVAEVYQGEIDRFDGQTATLIFGRILQLDDHRLSAQRAVFGLKKVLIAKLDECVAEASIGELNLDFALTVAAGQVVAGPVGVDYRKVYTAFGGPVVEAERLLKIARGGEIVAALDSQLDLLREYGTDSDGALRVARDVEGPAHTPSEQEDI